VTAGPDAPRDAVARIFDENPPPRIGVAVSGGGDSMALLVAAQAAFPSRIAAVTVDHGLRPASADEARAVAAFCAGRGIAHSVLRWQGPKPTGNLMDQARRARILLISDWAKAQGIGDVLLGHTADDNAESLVMNLARSAGLDGLSGIGLTIRATTIRALPASRRGARWPRLRPWGSRWKHWRPACRIWPPRAMR
jgi:tRNA(Ile)-lysidine synthase